MENEVLELWADKRRRCFLSRTIWMGDCNERRVIVRLRDGVAPEGEFVIDLPRPRDVAEVRVTRASSSAQSDLDVLRDEVLKGYAQQSWWPER